jgi:hypothetical protein
VRPAFYNMFRELKVVIFLGYFHILGHLLYLKTYISNGNCVICCKNCGKRYSVANSCPVVIGSVVSYLIICSPHVHI